MLHLRALRISLVVAIALSCRERAFADEKVRAKRHVVVVVWDGMRPDFVSEKNTPTLWKLAKEGVIFRNHHAVYPSATNVNGTAMVTGFYPGKNGVIANYVYRPEIDRTRSVYVETPAVVDKGDELSNGKYILFPTIAELVQRTGGRTLIATAKTVGFLLDRHRDPDHAKNGLTLFAGRALPSNALSWFAALGPFPSVSFQKDEWTTKAVTDFSWKNGVPTFSLLWLGNPDLTQHETAPGAPSALAAIKASDQNLAAVLSALDSQGCAKQQTSLWFLIMASPQSNDRLICGQFFAMPASARRPNLPMSRKAEIS